MLHSLLSIKIAAMASALGLNTSDWKNPSKEMVGHVQTLEKAMANIADPNLSGNAQSEINTTINAIRSLADQGDKDAQFSMALLSQQGNNAEAMAQALKYYELAAKQGQLQAMNNYGFMLAANGQDAVKAKEGIEWIKKASDAGLNGARRNMAQVYINGLGGEKQDLNAAEKLLTAAAAEKDGQAAFELSQFYASPVVKEKQSFQKAYDFLQQAANLGNANGLDTMGSLFIEGGKIGDIEVKANPNEAVKLFQKLADQKNPVGLRKMGGIYESGLGDVKPDFKKSMENYSAAAQGNDALAQFRLANLYNTGFDLDPKDDKIEVQPNAAAALNLFRAAAQNGIPLASHYVGMYYEQGRTVDPDATKAFAFFQQAAQQGVPIAMVKVGMYYFNGTGTVKDPVAAVGWFGRAASTGLPEGHLNYGIAAEMGLSASNDGGSPFFAAADAYLSAAKSPVASDPTRMEALLRLGSLHYRGVLVGAQEAAKPNLEKAYTYFKLASDIDPKNPTALAAQSEVDKLMTTDQKKTANEEITKLKAEFEAARKSANPAPAPAAK